MVIWVKTLIMYQTTINSIQAKLRKVYKLKVNDDWSLEAIMIPKMKLQLQQHEIKTYGMN